MRPVTILRQDELHRSPLSLLDETGAVYFWQGKVLRGVPAAAEPRVRLLFQSGLLQALMERGWIPRCGLSDVGIEGCALVVQQEKLPVVSYPYEWSFGMLRDAALRVLEIAELAHSFGWELHDTHGFNVVFEGPRPLWVDMGSFAPRPAGATDWRAVEDFVRFYEYPLRIWRDGGGFMARRLVAVSDLMNHSDHGLYRWPCLRAAGLRQYQRLVRGWYQLGRAARLSDAEFRRRLPGVRGAVVQSLIGAGLLPGQAAGIPRRRARLLRLQRRQGGGLWSDYQGTGAASVTTPRFRRIGELVRAFAARSIVELGGNQGWLGEELLREGAIDTAISTDADEPAVDRGYERTKAQAGRQHRAVIDFVAPMVNPVGTAPNIRLKADAVLALAVAHHLLLTQRIPVERMLGAIGTYGRRLVFVEFMPLGLWGGGEELPPVPAWYTLDWFRAAFVVQFDLAHEEVLEKNRHLFCGRIHKGG